MAIGIGIDIGSVSIKLAIIGGDEDKPLLRSIAERAGFFTLDRRDGDCVPLVLSRYIRIKGQPLEALDALLRPLRDALGDRMPGVTVTGSGARLASSKYHARRINEFSAIVDAVNLLYPETRTVFEMGGETSKYILLERNARTGKLTIVDYGTNGDCAAGTGAFMDQQASRLKYRIEDVGGIVLGAVKSAQIAGRCSVFAKSDMIHAQQRGYAPDEVLKGLCDAVARNFKSAISRSRRVEPPVLFIGGVAMNAGMVQSMRNVFGLGEGDLHVPDALCWF